MDEDITYYAELYKYIKEKFSEALVVLNSGTNAPKRLLDYCDYLVVFEGDPSLLSQFQLNPDLASATNKRIVLVHDVNINDYRTVVNKVKSLGVDSMYITEGPMPNPWDTLSQYYEELVCTEGYTNIEYHFSKPNNGNNNTNNYCIIYNNNYKIFYHHATYNHSLNSYTDYYKSVHISCY